jgi:hypothetical protein
MLKMRTVHWTGISIEHTELRKFNPKTINGLMPAQLLQTLIQWLKLGSTLSQTHELSAIILVVFGNTFPTNMKSLHGLTSPVECVYGLGGLPQGWQRLLLCHGHGVARMIKWISKTSNFAL